MKKKPLKRTMTPSLQLPDEPVLRFTPYAWAKLQYFCHRGDTEIGGFGITPGSPAPGTPGSFAPGTPGSVGSSVTLRSAAIIMDGQDEAEAIAIRADKCEGDEEVFGQDGPLPLLLIEDFVTVEQETSSVSVEFDDEAVANYFEEQVDQGRHPHEFARIWLHTHPGDSATPSGTDEETFARVFGPCDWAVMFILAKGGQTYARLRFNVGPGGSIELPVEVDYSLPFAGSSQQIWEQQYLAHIHPLEQLHMHPLDYRHGLRDQNLFGLDDLESEDLEWMAMAYGLSEEDFEVFADEEVDDDRFI